MQQTMTGIILGLCVVVFPVLLLAAMRLIEAITETIGLLKTIVMQLSKIEQVTMATLSASENFVDALTHADARAQINDDGFEDLRKSFEGGIKDFEDTTEDEDDEPWKK